MIHFQNIQKKLIEEIQGATTSIRIAVTWFTNNEIFAQIIKKLENDNLKIELVVLNDQINNKIDGNDFQEFIDLGGAFYFSNIRELVHHKFCIIDNIKVLNGSYNWTYCAENRNWENISILEDSNSVKSFNEEFERILIKHKKVEKINDEILYNLSIDSIDYLRNEYQLQVDKHIKEGNTIYAGKLIMKVLEDDNNNTALKNQKNKILEGLNTKDEFDVCPFEIGIKYHNGYSVAIPAFEKLPFEITLFASTVINNQSSIQNEFQKSDNGKTTMFTVRLPTIKKSEKGTRKVSYRIRLERNGQLEIYAKELDGHNYVAKKSEFIQNWL